MGDVKILSRRSVTVQQGVAITVSIAMICFLPVLHVGAQVDGRQSRVRQLLQGPDGGATRVLTGHGRAGRPRGRRGVTSTAPTSTRIPVQRWVTGVSAVHSVVHQLVTEVKIFLL